MQKDFSPKNTTRNRGKKSSVVKKELGAYPTKNRPIFAAGLFIGLIVGGSTVALYTGILGLESTTDMVTEHPKSSAKPNVVFTFPTELSKSSVLVDPSAYGAPDRVEPLDYILQVATFANAKRAEELRANLILESFQASTLVAEVGAKISYRVIVGPFKRKVEAERKRTALRALSYEPILIPKPIKPEKTQG